MSEKQVSVPTVAFAYLSPVALRVFLKFGGGYKVSLFTGEELDLNSARPSKNIVVLPNFANVSKLAPYADQIGRLIILSNNQHNKLAQVGIPILDAVVDEDGNLHRTKPRTPHYYTKLIDEAAVDFEINRPTEQRSTPPEKKKSEKKPKTLDNWFDILDSAVGESSFETVETPICLFLSGEIGKGDFQNALKALAADEAADQKALRAFYKWATTTDYARSLSKAVRAYLWPSTDEAPSISRVAKEFGVDEQDLDILEGVYNTQGGENVEEE